MRILLVSETLHAGGAETFVLRLCRKLCKEGLDCEVLNLNPDIENKVLLDQFTDIRISRVDLPFLKIIKKFDAICRKTNIDFSLQFYLSKYWIKKHFIGKFDIYHTHLIKVDYLFAVLKKQYPDMKIVSTVHGDYSDYYYKYQQGKRLYWLNFTSKLKVISASLNKWVVITEEQQAFFKETLGLPAAKIEKFYNGFESTVPLIPGNRDVGKLVIGMVARGVRLKGWDLLIEAFLAMPENCELRLVGTGDFLDSLRVKYQNHPRIIFVGFHPNPVEEIMNFDVFVLPSLFPYESLPTVIIEALFCGKPIVATRVGEIPEMIIDPVTGASAGFLLDFDGHRIQVNQLYGYLMAYYNDRSLVSGHGALSVRAFDKFNMNTCFRNYSRVYQTV
jgi:glycosyltransferase involved in cell wall biosynthesis